MPRIVDTWLFDLDPDATAVSRCMALLGPDERHRLTRLRRPCDQRRFLIRRGLLRSLLGRYLHVDPRQLAFSANRYGKPRLSGHSGLRFNTSSSRDVGLCVVSRDAELGCDLEHRDPDRASPEVADRFFATGERRALQALPREKWLDGFFACWTRKEAVAKALGQGLSLALDAFEVPLGPDEATIVLRPGCAFRVAAFAPSPALHIAVAMGGAEPAIIHAPRPFAAIA